jgi:hypothetical protein
LAGFIEFKACNQFLVPPNLYYCCIGSNFKETSWNIAEALASLQAAAADVLIANGRNPASARDPHVLRQFACEIDTHCQRVLRDTYGCCCYPDIMKFDSQKPTHFCVSHNQHCPTIKNSDKKRNSAKVLVNVHSMYCFAKLPTALCVSLRYCPSPQDWTSMLEVQTLAMCRLWALNF